MRDLVRGEIVEHKVWREYQPPRKRQHAGGRTRTPAARLIADRHALDGNAEGLCGKSARGFQIALGLAFEKIANPARDMRRRAGDAEQALASRAGLDPDRAARA